MSRPSYLVISAETTAMDGTKRKLRATYKESELSALDTARKHINNRCKTYIWLGVEINVYPVGQPSFSFIFEG